MADELIQPILVVEDDQIDAEYILKILERFDIPFELAGRSYEAIELLHRKDGPRPCLILLDWRIPGGGASVLRAVKENPSLATIPVVVLSRSTAVADVKSAYAGHANMFIAKPAELRDFQDQVAGVCNIFLNIAQRPSAPDTDSYVSSPPSGASAEKARKAVSTIVIIDDDRLTTEHLEEQLNRDGGFECVWIAHNASVACELVQAKQPTLIVLDLMLREGGDPIDLAAKLVSLSPESRIIICTAWAGLGVDDEQMFLQKARAARSGVIDWVSKDRSIREVIARVRHAAEWAAHPVGPSPLEQALGQYLRTAGSVFKQSPFDNDTTELTPAEARIATTVARGLEADMTIEEIAKASGLAPATVRVHIKNVYSKWSVHTLAGFLAEARRRGVVSS